MLLTKASKKQSKSVNIEFCGFFYQKKKMKAAKLSHQISSRGTKKFQLGANYIKFIWYYLVKLSKRNQL